MKKSLNRHSNGRTSKHAEHQHDIGHGSSLGTVQTETQEGTESGRYSVTLLSHQVAFNTMTRTTKTKISLTIDTALLEWIDEQVKNFTFQSRSHALEQAVYHLKKEIEKEKR